MRRRRFLEVSGAGALAAAAMPVWAANAPKDRRPNILVIMADQHWADAMSAVIGNTYLRTPNLDALAERGRRFTRAYSPNPLCMPMRTSMITGRFPHQTGILTNSSKGFDADKFPFLGRLFKEAGFETAYFGKWHIPVSEKRADVHGFDTFVGNKAALNPSYAADFIRGRHDRPFLAFASFLTPHEICQWSRRETLPGQPIGDPPPPDQRPPLPANAAPPAGETDIMTHMRKSYQATSLFPVGDYTDDDWRRLIWGYYRLIERVDGFVGVLLGALRDAGLEENTLVVYLADHGDCHGAHRWNQKTVFYDESARVPFIMSMKDSIPHGTSDVLLNTGTDLMPTLCDFAGITPPDKLPGRSLKAPALGMAPTWTREFIVSENHMVQCKPVDGKDLKPHGRMVRGKRYKYCVYSEGQRRESLVDMERDPGEMTNLAENPDYSDVLRQYREYLAEWSREHGDRFPIA